MRSLGLRRGRGTELKEWKNKVKFISVNGQSCLVDMVRCLILVFDLQEKRSRDPGVKQDKEVAKSDVKKSVFCFCFYYMGSCCFFFIELSNSIIFYASLFLFVCV